MNIKYITYSNYKLSFIERPTSKAHNPIFHHCKICDINFTQLQSYWYCGHDFFILFREDSQFYRLCTNCLNKLEDNPTKILFEMQLGIL